MDLSVELAGIKMKNPVMTASGCFGYGREYVSFWDPGELGALVVKGTTLEPRQGNTPPRVVETAAGMLNSVGLQNPGVDKVIQEELPRLGKMGTPVIINIAGNCLEDYRELARRFEGREEVSGLEVNISCPNVRQGGMAFGTDALSAGQLVKSVRGVTSKPLMVKLSPNVTSVVEIARAVEDAGADAISLINTLQGMAIDIRRQAPVLGNVIGGLSGPAVKPVALRMVWQVAGAVRVPVVGMGGIMTGEDALEFIMAGAAAVAVGTAGFVDPRAIPRIIDDMGRLLAGLGYDSVRQAVGAAREER